VEVAELFADGMETAEGLRIAHFEAEPAARLEKTGMPSPAWDAWTCADRDARHAASEVIRDPKSVPAATQASLLREVFGNPWQIWRSKRWIPDVLFWSDGAVRKLAQAIYEERDFDRLSILADALEDAGCADVALLNHCRGLEPCYGCLGKGFWKDPSRTTGITRRIGCENCPTLPSGWGSGWIPLRGPHVHGCWVLSLLLGQD
jgi:hypothetical protein